MAAAMNSARKMAEKIRPWLEEDPVRTTDPDVVLSYIHSIDGGLLYEIGDVPNVLAACEQHWTENDEIGRLKVRAARNLYARASAAGETMPKQQKVHAHLQAIFGSSLHPSDISLARRTAEAERVTSPGGMDCGTVDDPKCAKPRGTLGEVPDLPPKTDPSQCRCAMVELEHFDADDPPIPPRVKVKPEARTGRPLPFAADLVLQAVVAVDPKAYALMREACLALRRADVKQPTDVVNYFAALGLSATEDPLPETMDHRVVKEWPVGDQPIPVEEIADFRTYNGATALIVRRAT